jgi:phage-related protein
MKKLYTLLSLAFLMTACSPEEIIEKQENLIIQAMTTGQWTVTSYSRAGTDITTDFSPYKFKFNTNFTVDALNGTSVEKSGDWNADGTAQTITSNFNNATHPLVLLNGTWTITKTTWTSVEANITVGTEYRTLRLDKQ